MFDYKKAARAQARLASRLRLEWGGRRVNSIADADLFKEKMN